MYPTELTGSSSYYGPGSRLLLLREPGAVATGVKQALRVEMRGGYYFEAPLTARMRLPDGRSPRVEDLRTGFVLFSPYDRPAPAGPCQVAYDYEWVDNNRKVHREKGQQLLTPLHAELLGWLVGDGTLHAERQSLRFANSDVWVLKHVERLVTRTFPSVKVTWYAKLAGYDITLTGGIKNPLRHFLRSMMFVEGWPTAVSSFDEECRNAFLRGYWGADGWVHVRKGGTDVDLGIRRCMNDGFTSLLRDLHASIGMRGQRRETPTKATPSLHRLVFSGYGNYRVFSARVGQVRDMKLEAPPVKRKIAPPPLTVDAAGCRWYETPISKIRDLGPCPCYEVPHA